MIVIYLFYLDFFSPVMNQVSFHSAPAAPPPPPHSWLPMLPPNPPQSSGFWETKNLDDRLRDLQETLILAKAMYLLLQLVLYVFQS